MAWTMSANLRGNFASTDLGDRSGRNDETWGKLSVSRDLLGKVRGLRSWGLRGIALMHLSLMALVLGGVASAPTQTTVVLTSIALCLAFLMSGVEQESSDTAEDTISAEYDNQNAPTTTYKLTSPNIAQAFADQTTRPGQAWTDLASRVSHELRTPLNAVIGFSDLMECELHGPLGSPQYNEYTRHISESGKALLKSAEDTLAMTSALARLDAPEATQSVELDGLIHSAWSTLQPEANARGITFINRSDANLTVVCDPITQRQILVNMLGDAVKSSLDNGTIIVTAKSVGSYIAIEITVTYVDKLLPCEDSLDLCLARALLEVQGAPLKILHQPTGTRRLQTVFNAAIQQELF